MLVSVKMRGTRTFITLFLRVSRVSMVRVRVRFSVRVSYECPCAPHLYLSTRY